LLFDFLRRKAPLLFRFGFFFQVPVPSRSGMMMKDVPSRLELPFNVKLPPNEFGFSPPFEVFFFFFRADAVPGVPPPQGELALLFGPSPPLSLPNQKTCFFIRAGLFFGSILVHPPPPRIVFCYGLTLRLVNQKKNPAECRAVIIVVFCPLFRFFSPFDRPPPGNKTAVTPRRFYLRKACSSVLFNALVLLAWSPYGITGPPTCWSFVLSLGILICSPFFPFFHLNFTEIPSEQYLFFLFFFGRIVIYSRMIKLPPPVRGTVIFPPCVFFFLLGSDQSLCPSPFDVQDLSVW